MPSPEPQDIDEALGTSRGNPNADADIDLPRVVPYDPAEDREKVRGRVVYGLLGLLGFLIVAPFLAILCGRSFEDMQPFLTLVFGSTTTLVGSAVGFYFGERKR